MVSNPQVNTVGSCDACVLGSPAAKRGTSDLAKCSKLAGSAWFLSLLDAQGQPYLFVRCEVTKNR